MHHSHSSSESLSPFFFMVRADHQDLPSFPTRRSSDLTRERLHVALVGAVVGVQHDGGDHAGRGGRHERLGELDGRDRKSTRLNSSHLGISYAVFCLKKKNVSENEKLTAYIDLDIVTRE